jgi:hypothetical protein
MTNIDLHSVDSRRFVTYKNDASRCFCQVRLDSGERVLVSGAKGEIKLVKLGFRGMIPIGTIATFGAAQIAQLFKPMLDNPSITFLHPLDMTSMMVSAMASISDLRGFLEADLQTQRAVVTAAAEAISRSQTNRPPDQCLHTDQAQAPGR